MMGRSSLADGIGLVLRLEQLDSFVELTGWNQNAIPVSKNFAFIWTNRS